MIFIKTRCLERKCRARAGNPEVLQHIGVAARGAQRGTDVAVDAGFVELTRHKHAAHRVKAEQVGRADRQGQVELGAQRFAQTPRGSKPRLPIAKAETLPASARPRHAKVVSGGAWEYPPAPARRTD